METHRRAVSVLIVTILALHAVPVAQELAGHRQTTWPIMAWGMYRKAYGPEQPITSSREEVLGITASGRETPLRALRWPVYFALFFRAPVGDSNTGLPHFTLNRRYFGPMAQGDSVAARRLAERLNLDRSDPLVAIVVRRRVYRLTEKGIVAEPVTETRYDVAGSSDDP